MISPTEQSFPAAGTEGTFTVTTTNDCGWVVATNANWITLGANSGAGTTTIAFAVQDNTTTSPRTGLIHVGGQTFTVLQDSSTPPACTYRISPKLQNLPASGGSGSFSLTTGQSCAWEATTPDPWITITSSGAGTGNATITYTASPNSGRARKGTIRVADQVFSVKQRG
jgi:hypothetical protein